jgi:urease accessory protein
MHELTRIAQPTDPTEGWTARLELAFAQRGGQTYLARRRHIGPLIVQRPFFPEPHACHVYVVHPPGGVVGGDELTIDVRANAGSHVLLTTPAATKFYRCESKRARQVQHIAIDDAVLEWLPQETIFYPGALARSETIVRMDRSSSFIGWEIPCLGLPARGEGFDRGELQLNMELWVDDEPRLIDRLRIDGNHKARHAVWGLNSCDAIGTLLAYPTDRSLLEPVRAIAQDGVEFAVSIVDDVMVCRALGRQAEAIKRQFVAAWQVLRQAMLGKEALAPRIWAT